MSDSVNIGTKLHSAIERAEDATEIFVVRAIAFAPKNRFELVATENSPLVRKTSFYVLRGMEERGLITSRILPNASHRTYSLP